MMTEKRFKHLKKHYDVLEEMAYMGMVFWFVLFILASMFKNDIVCYICIIMFILHFTSVCILFDDCRLWRWIKLKTEFAARL